ITPGLCLNTARFLQPPVACEMTSLSTKHRLWVTLMCLVSGWPLSALGLGQGDNEGEFSPGLLAHKLHVLNCHFELTNRGLPREVWLNRNSRSWIRSSPIQNVWKQNFEAGDITPICSMSRSS